MTGEIGHRGGSGEPLVLIHGFAGSWHNWDPVLAPLEAHHDVLAVALAGHMGGLPLPAGTPVSVSALVDAVERDIDAAGFPTAHFAGNSLGGRIAFELARRGRARSVVALSPAAWWETGDRAEARARRFFSLGYGFSKRMLPHVRTLVTRPRLRRAVLRGSVAHGERMRPVAAAELIRAGVDCPIYFDLMEAILREGPPRDLRGVDCPVLIAWGTKDRTLPARRHAEGMRRLLPQAEWVDLPGAGHVPTFDDPERVAGLILDFAARAT